MSSPSELALLPIPTTREEALSALGTPDAELRRLVVRALERSPVEAARSVLATALSDDDWRVRKEAVQLAYFLAEKADIISILIDALRAPAESVALRNAAVEALAGLGASAVEAVESALSQPPGGPALGFDADGRKLAIEVLGAARQPRSLPVVIGALDDSDPNVRAAAAEAIGLIGGDDAAIALLGLLAHDDRFLRLIALEGLNRLSTPVPFDRVEPFLADRILRHASVAALARADDSRALPALVEAVGDVSSRHVAETALRSLSHQIQSHPELSSAARGALSALSPRGRERIVSAALGNDVNGRRATLPLLALLGDPTSIDALVRALADDELAVEAEVALGTVGGPALDCLIDAARRGDSITRTAVIRMLPRVASSSGRVIDTLRETLRDSNPEVVAASAAAFASALGAGMLPDAGDVHALLRAAASREPKVAAIALQTLRTLARVVPDAIRPHLSHVDTADEEAPVVCALLSVAGGADHVPWLSRALSAESPRTRRAAVEALGQIGGGAAASAITFAVTDEVTEVALAAIKALGRARDQNGGAPGVPPLLNLIASSGEPSLISAAVRALGQSGDSRAADALRPLTAATSAPLACSALEALAELEVSDLAAIAYRTLDHPSSIVVRAALDVIESVLLPSEARASAPIGREPAVAALSLPGPAHPIVRMLSHESWEVRRRAAELTARLDPRAARPLLIARTEVETEPTVRDSLHRMLAGIDHRVGMTSRPPPPRGEGER